MNDFEEFKTLPEKVIADVVEIARELELEEELEKVPKLLQPHHEAVTDLELQVFKTDTISGEDAVKIVQMTSENLEYYMNIVYKAVLGFERIHYNFERSSTMDKMFSNRMLESSPFVKGTVN